MNISPSVKLIVNEHWDVVEFPFCCTSGNTAGQMIPLFQVGALPSLHLHPNFNNQNSWIVMKHFDTGNFGHRIRALTCECGLRVVLPLRFMTKEELEVYFEKWNPVSPILE